MLRDTLLHAARSGRLRRIVEAAPVSRDVVRRFVAGDRAQDAVLRSAELVGQGLRVSLDHLGEDTTDAGAARQARAAYLSVLRMLAETGLTEGGRVEVSIKLSALGQALPEAGTRVALENARAICEAARTAGTTVTVDAEDHTTTDATLATVVALREDFPDVAAVLQAYLRRTEADCADLAGPGSRVRLCKGAYDEPASVAFRTRREVDLSFVRCLKVLMAGQGHPLVATHDPRLVDLAGALAVQNARPLGSYEFQMLYGVRPEEQRRLAERGESVRVYVPYGVQWYGYLMRRLAERPANATFFVRALVSRG